MIDGGVMRVDPAVRDARVAVWLPILQQLKDEGRSWAWLVREVNRLLALEKEDQYGYNRVQHMWRGQTDTPRSVWRAVCRVTGHPEWAMMDLPRGR
jgi:hypothetical protein